jgi:hypothetical protein
MHFQLHSLVLEAHVENVNLRPSMVIRGNQRTIDWKGQREYCGKLTPPRLKPPSVSIKDQWVGTCE